MAFLKDGLVALTKITEHACRLLTKFRPKMDTAIAAAVAAGAITSAQQATLHAWLDATAGACAILKAITGY